MFSCTGYFGYLLCFIRTLKMAPVVTLVTENKILPYALLIPLFRWRMFSDPIPSVKCSEFQFKSNAGEIRWKTLMKECLLKTEIFKRNENKSEIYLSLDPNSVMDLRHKRVKESPNILRIPQAQIYTKALDLLRVENQKRMLKQKEGKMVEREIARLKHTLENERLLTQTELCKTTKKTKSSPPQSRFAHSCAKQWKRLETQDGVYEVDSWLSQSFRMTMETKINKQGIPFDVKVSLKRKKVTEEFSESVSELQRISTKARIELDEGKNVNVRIISEHDGKSENKDEQNDVKKGENIEKVIEMERKINLKRVKYAWVTWKVYIQESKTRKTERTVYKSKIEAFLSKLKAKEIRETTLNATNNNREIKTSDRSKEMANNGKNQSIKEEREEHLKKVMEEVKTSQVEAIKKLKEVRKFRRIRNFGKSAGNVPFLKRMEERRKERLKRWEEIREKKRNLEEKKKIAETQREDSKKREEEERRRKQLEESKEKRRLAEEKKEERRREREATKEKMKQAEDHYGRYLLRNYGLRPWIRLLEIRVSQEQLAAAFFQSVLSRAAFREFLGRVKEQKKQKIGLADEFRGRMLKKNFLRLWLEFRKEKMEQHQVAVDWNEWRTTETAFKKWLEFTQNEQLEYMNKKQIALLTYERKLKEKCFKKLKDYPELKRLERAREERKQMWRRKVKEILPDYEPVEVPDAKNITIQFHVERRCIY